MSRSNRKPGVDRKHSTGRNRRRPRICYANRQKHIEKYLSASGREIRDEDVRSADFSGYRLFDLSLLIRSLRESVCCTVCHGPVVLTELSLRGLGGRYEIRCENCEVNKTFVSSSIVGDDGGYEINRRSALAMRCIGQGLSGHRTFCGIMDLPPPVQLTTWKEIGRRMLEATNDAVREITKEAAEEEVTLMAHNDGESVAGTSDLHPVVRNTVHRRNGRCITVQGDASWQRRGFSSLNAVFSVIGSETGKVLDHEVLSLFCRRCRQWAADNKNATSEDRENWVQLHQDSCTKNCSGSSGSMLVDGMMKIFHRSVDKYAVKYTNYIGNGDTKSYSKVASSMPYGPNVELQKVECAGHLQTRFGNRARKLKASLNGKKLSDGKLLGGRGRLTNGLIDEMEAQYGNALRNNPLSLRDMTEAIWAVWYHMGSTDEKPQHRLCPPGARSWCTYRQAEATGRLLHYYHSPGKIVPQAVMEAVRPVFEELSSPELLQRCIRAKTQNSNESLHSLIWKFCPKTVFTGMNTVQISSNLGIILYNSGPAGIIKVMESFGLVPGNYALTAANHKANSNSIL